MSALCSLCASPLYRVCVCRTNMGGCCAARAMLCLQSHADLLEHYEVVTLEQHNAATRSPLSDNCPSHKSEVVIKACGKCCKLLCIKCLDGRLPCPEGMLVITSLWYDCKGCETFCQLLKLLVPITVNTMINILQTVSRLHSVHQLLQRSVGSSL